MNKKLDQLVSITGNNINLSEILNQIGSMINVNFFLAENKIMLVKEIAVNNQPALHVLRHLCDQFLLKYKISSNTVTIESNNPTYTHVYHIKFFHTNDNQVDRKMWKNDVFWESVSTFLQHITKEFAIDKYNGTICVTCDKKSHQQIHTYIEYINRNIYRPVIIRYVFLEYAGKDIQGSGLSNILNSIMHNQNARNSLEQIMKTGIINILSEVTKNKINHQNCKILTTGTLNILPQQVANIVVKESNYITQKDAVFAANNVNQIISKQVEQEKDGLFFTVTPLIVDDQVLCKISFEAMRSNEINNKIQKSSLSTTVKLKKDEVSVLGDLISSTKISISGKHLYFIPYKTDINLQSNIVLLLSAEIKEN